MDFERAFKFPTDDPDWIKKVVIGAILSIIPIVNFISFGYALELLKNIIDSKEELPEWSEFGGKFVKGLVAVIIYIIYMLIPAIIMFVFGGTSIMAMANGHDAAIAGGIVGFGITMLLVILLAFVIGFIIPMAIANYIAYDEFGAAFRFSQIFDKIKDNFSDYIIMYLIIIVVGAVSGFLAGLIPFIGMLIAVFINFYISLVYAFILGKIYIK
ncbi:hypothetical protein HNP87_000959 [Methanococcus maripaludis]|uniref:DUF4013 domain-containing protein n=1 Tax=Methanococcus maripaludis TaxID=39152 RepID=A0A7J9NIG6_METMI|nr:DUF4013 domain-containing protein [Methanococcus maripaludis]MBA2840427.1 hypothetical protein [Methanococcus maripaludis]MBA2860127.1 hypothetical protein [Methanococcus maripaludis]MBA2869410.1 hypothetical protein [Methanococcus maripaludis]